jgi:hypothetical protein
MMLKECCSSVPLLQQAPVPGEIQMPADLVFLLHDAHCS